ncbi:MAG: hypothetical protein ACKO8H_18955, partial [Microcystis panniformis]
MKIISLQSSGDYFYLFFLFPTPYTPHPTPHTPHPTPHTLHPTPQFIIPSMLTIALPKGALLNESIQIF